MRRIKTVILVALLFLVGGCTKEVEENEFVPNANRGQAYEYDYINYLDIDVVGPNGYAIIEISLSDFKASDFKDEISYIAVRKLMNSLEPMVRVSKGENIANGDIITVGISSEYTAGVGELSFSLEPYQIQVSGLAEPEPIDLFDNSSVGFYNLEGTREFYSYVKRDSSLPKEIQENLTYQIDCFEEDIVADQTILNIKAKMDEQFINDGNYETTDRYIKLQGFTAEYEAEKVLKQVISPIDFEKANTEMMVLGLSSLYIDKEFTSSGITFKFDKIANIQSIKDYKNGFEYYVHSIWYNPLDESQELCLRDNIKMVVVDNQLEIIKSSSRYDNVKMMDNCYSTPSDRIERLQLILPETSTEEPAE